MGFQKNKNQQGGILRTFLIIVVIIFILSFLGVNIQSLVESDTTQENVEYVTDEASSVWHQYLRDPILWLWNDVFVDLLWAAFVENMERIRDDEPTIFDELAPGVQNNQS